MKTRLLVTLIAITIGFAAHAQWDGTSSPWTQGSGTQSDPYLVETPQQLAYLADMVSGGVNNYNGVYFLQTADLNMSNRSWLPIGDDTSRAFRGHYNGGNHRIDNVLVNNSTYNYLGLFGCINGGSVRNVRCNVRITQLDPAVNHFAGGVCAWLKNGTIDHCIHSGMISDTLPDNYYYGEINSDGNNYGAYRHNYIGGIVGFMSNSTVSRCGNTGAINFQCNSSCYEYLSYIYHYRNLSMMRVAGVVGYISTGHVVSCFNRGDIYLKGQFIYDLNIYYGSNINIASPLISGVANGADNTNNSIAYCYNTANISQAEILHNDSYNTSIYYSAVINGVGNTHVALESEYDTGNNTTTVKNSYNTGSLSRMHADNTYVVIYGVASQNMTNSYYRSGCGATEGGISRAESSMKSVSFPVILNTDSTVFISDLYNMNGGYPIHAWSAAYNITTDEADNLTSYTARMKGHYSGHADSVGFIYWSQGGNVTRVYLASETSPCEMILTGLQPSTQYHYSFFTRFSGITAYGDTLTFSTHPIYTVSVTTNNAQYGSVSGSGSYGYGEVATLTATPTEHYELQQWSDGNTDNPRYLTVTGNTSLTAVFGLAHHTVTLSSNNANYGSTTGSGSYEYGSFATINAVPATHYHFTQWSDGNTSALRTLHIIADVSLTAYFAPDQHMLTVLSGDNTMGTVSGSGTFDYGTVTTITATPLIHYQFQQWSDGNTENPRYVQISGDATYSAIFVPVNHTISLSVNNTAWGSTSGGGTYPYGSSQMISATPTQSYHFTAWSDGNSDNPRVINVTGDLSLTAVFAPNQYTVSLFSNDPTKGTVSGGGTFNYGTQTYIIATPLGNYTFSQWSDGNTDAYRLITVTQDITYTAIFADSYYTITALSNNDQYGSVAGSGNYINGSQVTLTATASTGYHFMQWNDGNTENPRTVTVNGDITYTAQFVPNSYTVTVSSTNPTMGSVSGSGSYTYGTQAVLQAYPIAHHHFTSWQDGNSDNPRILVVSADTAFTASFAIDQYTITVLSVNTDQGTVSGSGTYDYGTQVTISATAAEHYHFVQWNDGNTENPRTVSVNGDITYTAQFAPNSYTLNVTCNDTTMGYVNGGGTFVYGTQVTISATALPHYNFVQWSDDIATNPRTLTVTSDSTITAIFSEEPRYTVTVVSDNAEQGSVSGGGSFYAGEQTTIMASAEPNYLFDHWSDNSTEAMHTVTVTSDVTYTAYFFPVTYSVNVYSNDDNLGTVGGSGNYQYGQQATVTATPAAGCRFVRWNNGVESNPYTFTVYNDVNLIANFERSSGIEDAESANYRLAIKGLQIAISGAEGLQVSVMDIMGREMVHNEQYDGDWINIGKTGIFIVKINNLFVKKITLIH